MTKIERVLFWVVVVGSIIAVFLDVFVWRPL